MFFILLLGVITANILYKNKKDFGILSVSCGYNTLCYTNTNGELYVEGYNSDGQLGKGYNKIVNRRKVDTPTKVKKAVLNLHSLIYIDENDEVFCIGIYYKKDNKILRTTTPKKIQGITDIIDIKAGASHFLALDKKRKKI